MAPLKLLELRSRLVSFAARLIPQLVGRVPLSEFVPSRRSSRKMNDPAASHAADQIVLRVRRKIPCVNKMCKKLWLRLRYCEIQETAEYVPAGRGPEMLLDVKFKLTRDAKLLPQALGSDPDRSLYERSTNSRLVKFQLASKAPEARAIMRQNLAAVDLTKPVCDRRATEERKRTEIDAIAASRTCIFSA